MEREVTELTWRAVLYGDLWQVACGESVAGCAVGAVRRPGLRCPPHPLGDTAQTWITPWQSTAHGSGQTRVCTFPRCNTGVREQSERVRVASMGIELNKEAQSVLSSEQASQKPDFRMPLETSSFLK